MFRTSLLELNACKALQWSLKFKLRCLKEPRVDITPGIHPRLSLWISKLTFPPVEFVYRDGPFGFSAADVAGSAGAVARFPTQWHDQTLQTQLY